MTRRTTRIAALGAGALFSLGILGAAPAGASDAAQADATVSADDADVIHQTLGLVNQACQDATSLSGAAASALTSTQGISVAANPAGSTLGLNVSLPALTEALPKLDGLPVLGSVGGEVEAAAAQPLQVSCSTSAEGTGLGLSAAGADALVRAIVPGVDVSTLGIDLPALGLSGSATTGSADAGATQVSATAAGSVPTKARVNTSSPAVRASAAAPATTTTAAVSAAPASASGGIVAQTVGSPGALARTGAGVSALGLLGSVLFGSGRLLGFGRKLLKIG
jgi:hypothetical protein